MSAALTREDTRARLPWVAAVPVPAFARLVD
jgi:hypothetical protein